MYNLRRVNSCLGVACEFKPPSGASPTYTHIDMVREKKKSLVWLFASYKITRLNHACREDHQLNMLVIAPGECVSLGDRKAAQLYKWGNNFQKLGPVAHNPHRNLLICFGLGCRSGTAPRQKNINKIMYRAA